MCYIQITSKCNMSCEHCCMDATKDGEDMTEKVFRKAIEMDDCITLGGGEPTVHPKFWKFMVIVLAKTYLESLWLATNGSNIETSLALAKLAESGVIGCALSLDDYHDPIDEKVKSAFKNNQKMLEEVLIAKGKNDRREIRSVTEICRSGRAKNWGDNDSCPCSETIVKPNGDVYWCGCDDSPKVGNVLLGRFDEEWENSDHKYDCHREYLKQKKKI